MGRKYKIKNPEGVYFVSFAKVGWIDVFTRRIYNDILIDSLIYCQKEKGLEIYSWVIMSNHVRLICSSKTNDLSGTIRDLKRHTAEEMLKTIENNIQESRKKWMLTIFKKAGTYNSNNANYHSFGGRIINQLSYFRMKLFNKKLIIFITILLWKVI